MTRSNNRDRDKVLATVAGIVIIFLSHYPQAMIFVKGSTPSRTRLYQMGIIINWKEINQHLIIEGFIQGSWIPFESQGNYEAFLAKLN